MVAQVMKLVFASDSKYNFFNKTEIQYCLKIFLK